MVMKNILTIEGLKINEILSHNTVNIAVLLTAAVLFTFSSNVFANRPAMDERSEASNEAEEVTADTQAEMPSAVEVMMQQQTQQTQQSGDVLELPAKEMQPGETLKIKLLDFPRRGMSMDKVQNEYGQPVAISDSVGKPPITRWTYNDRVVYFEYSTVLHVVAR